MHIVRVITKVSESQTYAQNIYFLKICMNLFEILLVFDSEERSCERVDYDQFLPRNGLFGSLQRFLNH